MVDLENWLLKIMEEDSFPTNIKVAAKNSYLKKESLGSLFKEHQPKAGGFMESLKLKGDVSRDTVYKAVFNAVKKLLKECSEKVDENGVYDMTPVMRYVDPKLADRFWFKVPTKDEQSMAHYSSKDPHCLTIAYKKEGKEMHYVGSLAKKLRSKWDMAGRRWTNPYEADYPYSEDGFIQHIDTIRFFGALIMQSELLKYVDQVKCLPINEQKDNVLYNHLWEENLRMNPYDREYEITGDYSVESCDLMSFAEQYGYSYHLSEKPRRTFMTKFNPFWRIYYKEPVLDFSAGFSTYLTPFFMIAKDYAIRKARERYLKDVASEYATSYMDLKNMPQKYKDAAGSSAFAKVFGYVEYDPECDLESMKELEKEFEAIKEVFGMTDLSEYNLRFRKLGHHKASGLYFPSLNCLCVDGRMADSFVHEFFHLQDFKNGELSLLAKFYSLRTRYEKILRDSLKKMDISDPMYGVLTGKSKYNLDYYLEPTEIFARCGEMYAERVLGVSNTLLQPRGGFAYPDDKVLNNMIKEYYDYFFTEIMGKKNEGVA